MNRADFDEDLALLALGRLPQMGPTRARRMLAACGSARATLAAPAQVWADVLGKKLSHRARQRPDLAWARQQLRQLHDLGGELLCWYDADYPPWLAALNNAPLVLYIRGDRRWLQRPAVAVVGSRRCSSYGRRVATRLAADLAARGVCVVSGMARGIDGAAHEGALQAEGGSIAVLGCGVDVVYPAEHRHLYRRLVSEGLVISEEPLAAAPEPNRFPRRNRIVSGLSLAVIVVEAPQRSGALMTARLASEQGRDVFAVPGEITNPRCAGCLALLRDGAGLVRTAADVIDELAVHLPPDVHGAPPAAGGLRQESPSASSRVARSLEVRDASADLTAAEIRDGLDRQLLAVLNEGQQDIDALSRHVGMAVAQVQAVLLRLELQGRIQRLPGQQYAQVS